MKNLAVFDLDGTLILGNSLFEIVQAHKNTWFYDCVLVKVLDVFLKLRACMYKKTFSKLQVSKIASYKPIYRKNALSLLNALKNVGYEVVIASCAQEMVLKSVAGELNLPYLKCKPMQKLADIKCKYNFEKLLVITDNKTDCDLICAADFAVIYSKKANISYFKSLCKNVIILDKDALK